MLKHGFLVLLVLFAAFILFPSQVSAFSNLTLGGSPARWWPEDIPVKFYPNNVPNKIAGSSTYDYVRTAISWWNNAGANIQIQDAGSACLLGCANYSQNGKNELVFPSTEGGNTPTTIIQRYDCNQRMTVGGISYCRIIEVDIEFNAISADLATYALGQALGLDNSDVVGSVMNRRSLWYPGVSGLSSDDLQGIQSIYGKTTFLAGGTTTNPLPTPTPGVLAQLEQCNATGTGWDPIGAQCTNLCPLSPNCSITINNSTSGTVSSSVGSTFNITAYSPTVPFYISVSGPQSITFGPYNSSPASATWSTSGWPPGTYTVSNGCAQRTVNLGGLSCGSFYGQFNLTVSTFDEPLFDPNQWPQQCWWHFDQSPYELYCGSQILYSKLPQESTLAQTPSTQTLAQKPEVSENEKGQVLQASTCTTASECNDNNICTTDYCNIDPYTHVGTCLHSPQPRYTICGTSSFGGNLYCSGRTYDARGNIISDSICVDTLCASNSECNDGNVCTNPDYCALDDPFTGYGTCTNTPVYGSVCGTSSFGGNMYCGGTKNALGFIIPSGICSDSACKTDSECNDGSVCTTDKCTGYQAAACSAYGQCFPELLGSCTNSNLLPNTICQENPKKLCSNVAAGQTSTCSVDYVACTDVKAQNQFCCGLTNLQALPWTNYCSAYTGTCSYLQLSGSCQLAPFNTSWNRDSDHPFNNPLDNPISPLPNVVIHVEGDCGINQVQPTNSAGLSYFYLPFAKGSSTNFTRLSYKVWAEVPKGNSFTRGVYYTSTSRGLQENQPPRQILGPGGLPTFFGIDSGRYCVCDTFGCSCDNFYSRFATFGFQGPPTYKISGKIMLDNNFDGCLTSSQAVSGASLVSTNLSTGSSSNLTSTSDTSGNYSFTKLPSASYSLSVTNFTGRVVAQRVNGVWSSTSSTIASPLPLPPNQAVDFCVNNGSSAWIKASGGDVHSNTGINTPGGP